MNQAAAPFIFLLSACVSVPDGEPEGNAPATPDVEGIEYETGPCFGRCPVYRIALNADGSGLIDGRHGTAHQGERSFRISREQYRAFAARLAPYRPRGHDISYSGPPLCRQMATDLPSVTVTWHWPNRHPQRMHFYYGCDMERYREMAEQLRDAPSLLPIAELIGVPR
jgi:hypothetical protein